MAPAKPNNPAPSIIRGKLEIQPIPPKEVT